VYDGASALAEGALMAMRVTKRNKVLISRTVHPHYRQVVKTYLSGLQGIRLKEIPFHEGRTSLETLADAMDDGVAAILIQHPNFFGQLEEMEAITQLIHSKGGLLVMAVDPISLGVLKTPGEYQADIAVGEGQPMGNAVSYGGPYVGFFATRREMIRQMPGRVVGATTDEKGRPGFCLTLQTREQHIRRERATSNICTNQTLNALASAVYLATLGREGLREVALLCLAKSHTAYRKIKAIPGYSDPFGGPFFKEFVIHLSHPASRFLERSSSAGLFAGIDLGAYYRELKDHLLICITEQHQTEEIDRLVHRFQAAK
ncbi:MAG: aminomethyl-transferring glycine dehydrogenase subunit GcvPA, partial [Nitrospiria bacterium]